MLMSAQETQLFKTALTPVLLLHLPHKKPAHINEVMCCVHIRTTIIAVTLSITDTLQIIIIIMIYITTHIRDTVHFTTSTISRWTTVVF